MEPGGYDLISRNAPVATVAKVILGDVLASATPSIPGCKGTVTLASGARCEADALYVLENALR